MPFNSLPPGQNTINLHRLYLLAEESVNDLEWNDVPTSY